MDHFSCQMVGSIGNEYEEIKYVINQKKRIQSLEIRKKRLQNEFNKIRKYDYDKEQLLRTTNNYEDNSAIIITSDKENNSFQINNHNLEKNVIQDINKQQNNNIFQKAQIQTNQIKTQECLTQSTIQLNRLLNDLTEENSNEMDNILNGIFKYFCKEQQSEQVQEQFFQLFLHLSFFQIIKNAKTSMESKNTALSCLINMSCSQKYGSTTIASLIDNNTINLLKTFLGDNQYVLLYENTMILATNIAIDKNTYKQMFLDEGFLFVQQDYLFSVIERIKIYPEGISFQLLKSILSFCTSLLVIHHKIDNRQFMVIFKIMTSCLKQNIPGSFVGCLNGIYELFLPENPLNQWKFNILQSFDFLAYFFMMCTQPNHQSIRVSELIKNISCMDNTIIKALIPQGICLVISSLLDNYSMKVQKNILFSLSNFFQTGQDFINISSKLNLDVKILSILETQPLEIQKEGIFTLSSLLLAQSPEQKEKFFSNNHKIINSLCNFLNSHYNDIEDEVIDKLLECIAEILQFSASKTDTNDGGNDTIPSWQIIRQFQFVNVLEKIMENGSNTNSLKAAGIIETYCQSTGSYRDIFLYSGGAL